MIKIPENIIISRTDSIGDVMLTLPVAAVLKKHFPEITVAFMGKSYTKPVIEACKHVDVFIDADDFFAKRVTIAGIAPQAILHVFPTPAIAKRAKQLAIPLRIGTTNRLYHWFTCNKLVKLSRKNSPLHEAQLNIKLLNVFEIDTAYPLDEVKNLYGFDKLAPLEEKFQHLIKPGKYNLILHPKSQGNGREWPLDNFIQLIETLDHSKYNIFISGTEKDGVQLQPLFTKVEHFVTDLTGKMSLYQFIAFIKACDGLLASGTGPLHMAAALGKDALGIFPPIRPVHPGRWQPLGTKAKTFVLNKDCHDCKGGKQVCLCVKNIEAVLIKDYLDGIVK